MKTISKNQVLALHSALIQEFGAGEMRTLSKSRSSPCIPI